ncbi:MAG TPA: polysaccharide deacetylase family protein [Terracidiphilus sp.]|nr:polysaccharide deacetylase family protein [Terracidiphilus sp.]
MLIPLQTGLSIGLGAVAGAGLAAGGFAYAAMWPASEIFGWALKAPPRPGELALTFDDGPNPAWTPRLLDILNTHNVRATFFLVGKYAEAEPELTRRIAEEGHLIGNHSWSHPNLAIKSGPHIDDELMRTCKTLQDITGQHVKYFRPPFGGRRPRVLRSALELDMTPVLWNAITNDWKESSADRIAERLIRRVDHLEQLFWATNIVLHDGGHLKLGADRGPSVQAAGQILARYKHTHRFVTVDAWDPTVPSTPKNAE